MSFNTFKVQKMVAENFEVDAKDKAVNIFAMLSSAESECDWSTMFDGVIENVKALKDATNASEYDVVIKHLMAAQDAMNKTK